MSRPTSSLACTCRALQQRVRTPSPARTSLRQLHSSAAAFASSKSKGKGKQVDRWPGWEPVIGLELHVQLKGNVKLLSPARALYEAPPNSQIAPFDAALPGSLPTLGAEPVRLALLACLALKSNINPASTFDRKHYFYPDLPAGFQVTQKYSPLAKGGEVRIRSEAGGSSRAFSVRLDQIQLEQDTAKSSHDPETGMTLIDLNRAGAALIEIVTEPDMRTPEEAAAFVRALQAILRHVGTSDANMDRGELRCDVNVSVQRTAPGSPRGTRCEVKNLNGVRFLQGAIESEIARQIGELEAGRAVVQATRGYDAVTGQTFFLRGKEDAPDYRYMPDPELGPVVVSEARLSALRQALPELPDEAFDRLQTQYSLSPRDAGILVALGERMDDDAAEGGTSHSQAGAGVRFFEEVAKGREGKVAANWVLHELLGQLSKANLTLINSPISPSELGRLIDAVTTGSLTGTSAKSLLRTFLSSPPSTRPSLDSLIASNATTPSPADGSADEALNALCADVIEALPVEAAKVRAGQEKVLMRMVGEVMKRSKGRADAKKVGERLKELLKGE
ncbi:GatB/GatE catalytic domain-domain-containing protein [Leucosporidium creatinivorum]|uniref:Glutamyl-tRNA(Gln) amidotransferase subunit B, mitochondrial n=1 Tax=Leucosporidium creatinivorum TaxID=106004 RepID=A0A1Y2F2U4_9BASI|nr:GatB/GatE catalytic domain-domain-containing protein [Leucosporidium creatinivorum]